MVIKMNKKKIINFIKNYKVILILIAVLILIIVFFILINTSFYNSINKIVVENLNNGNVTEITNKTTIKEIQKILNMNSKGNIEDTFERLVYRVRFYHNDKMKYFVTLYENKNSYWISHDDLLSGVVGSTDEMNKLLEMINYGN